MHAAIAPFISSILSAAPATVRSNFAKLVACAIVFGAAGFAPAHAQTGAQEDPASFTADGSAVRPVGSEGRLRRMNWVRASERDLYALRLDQTARQLSSAPGAMERSDIWMARADVCATAGDEVLMQIRSPLTCGTLGCVMMVITESGGAPRVLLRTVGDTLDSPVTDEIIVNRGSSQQRIWRYARGRFRQQ